MSELEALAAEVAQCTRCLLHQGRTKTVPGEGPDNADIMFIGEAPGFHEDQQGHPFVGAAGKFLEKLLESIGLTRADVFIANVIKCRPPGNRDPLPEEIEACKPFLDRQIELLQPKLVVTLGRFSMARAFPKARISRIHGQPRKIGGVLYYPMYHPAAALHQPSLRSTIEQDMHRIPELIEQAAQIAESPLPAEAEQLSLF
ncbi:MAG: uracil-DNA glycosylase [Chloroflexi bacterium]|nr:MAG: uracil-DNA glycosylase [Chloroflexota bacterium]RLC84275.1 MAG: uracil-DNA glycosylase [Chloroflexota bacterium]HEY71780.1 uracil-DNA glycosylase [Thermoflexia bacterium]